MKQLLIDFSPLGLVLVIAIALAKIVSPIIEWDVCYPVPCSGPPSQCPEGCPDSGGS